MEAGKPNARLRAYRIVLTGEWIVALIVMARWVVTHRAWADLGLAMPTRQGLGVSAGLILAVGWLLFAQARNVARLPAERRAALLPRLGSVSLILPRTPEENRWFMALSVTAGICEELFYRGFVVWALRPWLGLLGAAALSVALFGFGHSYQGRQGAVRATLTGLVFAVLALVVHSIVPGMVLHAIVDLGGGATGYALLRDEPRNPAPGAPGRSLAEGAQSRESTT